MKQFVEEKINTYAQAIIDGSDKRDAHAMGELKVYMALRRVLKEQATIEDIGMMDAINDVMQEIGAVFEGETFLEMVEQDDDDIVVDVIDD